MVDFEENIQESFNYIAEALDSMRAQTAVNAGNTDRLMTEISNSLDKINNDETADLMKEFLVELKRGIDERQRFLAQRFEEIGRSFQNIQDTTDKQLTGSEIKELFEIIATNLNGVSRDFSIQRDLITNVEIKVETLQKDESKKDEIMRGLSQLKNEMERINNGFESTVLNLNTNFKDFSELLKNLDSTENFANLKKDVENIFLSSDAILSTMQVIDHKNRELEETINTFVTKEDFKLEREQVAQLISQNMKMSDFIEKLPNQNNFKTLTEKLDSSINVINALKNMLSETGKQNQEMLIAQLDNLETKILNISSEEEFIGFRKELSAFAKEVMESTNLIRSDLADTNQGLKSLYEFLNTMDIKNSFLNFTEITKTTEKELKENLVTCTNVLTSEMAKKQDVTKADIQKGVDKVKDSLSEIKQYLDEKADENTSLIVESFDKATEDISLAIKDVNANTDEKILSLSDEIKSVPSSVSRVKEELQKNSVNNRAILETKIDKIPEKVELSKAEITENIDANAQLLNERFDETIEKLENTKEDLQASARNNLVKIQEKISSAAEEIIASKNAIQLASSENVTVLDNRMGNLKEELSTAGNFIIQNSQKNLENILNDISRVLSEITAVRQTVGDTSVKNTQTVVSNFTEIGDRVEEIKNELNQNSKDNLENMLSIIENFSQEVIKSKEALVRDYGSSSLEIKEIMGGLSLKLNSLQDVLTRGYEVNFAEIKNLVEELTVIAQTTRSTFEKNTTFGFSGLSASLEDISNKISVVQDTADVKRDATFEKITALFDRISQELNASKGYLADTLKVDYEAICASFQEIGKRIDASRDNIKSSIKNDTDEIKESINSLPEIIKQNQIELEEEKRVLIDENSKNIQDIIEKIQTLSANILTKDNPFKEDVFYNFAEMRTQIGTIKGDFNKATFDLDNSVTNQINTCLSGLENLFNGYTEKYTSAYGELKARVEDYYVDVDRIANETEEKLKTSLAETYEIKAEILNLQEKIKEVKEDPKNYEIATELHKRFDRVLADITKLEENISEQTGASVQSVLVSLDTKFEGIISEIQENTNSATVQSKDILVDISEKAETLKNQINLTSTDIINSFSTRTSELASIVISFNENIDKIANINFSEEFYDVRKKLEKTIEILPTTVSTEIEKGNEAQIEKLSSDFVSLQEKLDLIISKVSSDNTKEINELKEILTERVDNISSINNILGAVLQQLNDIGETYTTVKETVTTMKSDIINKVSLTEDSILQSADVLKEELSQKATELQNKSTTVILEKAEELAEDVKAIATQAVHQYKTETKEDIASLKDTVYTKIQENKDYLELSTQESKQEVLDKIDETKDSLTRNQDDIRYTVIDEINKVSDETKENIADLKEIVLSNTNDYQSSIDTATNAVKETVIRSKDTVYTKIQESKESLELSAKSVLDKIDETKDSLTRNQDDTRYTVIDEINKASDETKAIIAEKIEELQEDTKKALVNKLVEFQEEARDSLVTSVTDLNERNNATTLYAIKENIASVNEQLKTALQDDASETKQQVLYKISTLLEVLENAKDEAISSMQNIQENQEKRGEILATISQKQGINAEILEKIIEGQNTNKITIVDELKQLQEDLQISILSEVGEVQTKNSTIILNELQKVLKTLTEDLSTEIVESQNSSMNNVLEEIKHLQQSLASQVLSNMKENQEEVTNSIMEELQQFKQKINAQPFSEITEMQEQAANSIMEELQQIKQTISAQSISDLTEQQAQSAKVILSQIETFQENTSTLFAEINSQQKETMSAFLEKLEDAQAVGEVELEEKAKQKQALLLIQEQLEDFKRENDSYFEDLTKKQQEILNTIIDEIKESQNDSDTSFVEDIENKQDENTNIILKELNEIQEKVIEKNIDIREKQNENINIILNKLGEIQEKAIEKINDIREKQDSNFTNIISQLQQNQEVSNEEFFEELKDKYSESANSIICELKQHQENAKQELFDNIDEKEEETRVFLINELKQLNSQQKESLISSLSVAQNDCNQEIIKAIREFGLSTTDEMATKLQEVTEESKETLISEVEKLDNTEEIKSLIDKFSESVERLVSTSSEDFKTTTEETFTEIRENFSEKLEDSFDNLKSFLEVISEKNNTDQAFENLRLDIYDKISEMTSDIDCSINSFSVKEELIDFSNEIQSSLGNLFDDFRDNISDMIDEKNPTEEISSTLEHFQDLILEKTNQKLDEVQEKILNQNETMNLTFEEVKNAIADLKESYIETSINSTSEMSSLLLDMQEKVDIVKENLEILTSSQKLDNIEEKICGTKEELLQEFNVITQRMGELVDFSLISDNQKSIKTEIKNLADKFENISSSNKEDLVKNLGELDKKLEIISKDNSEIEEIQALKKIVELIRKDQALGSTQNDTLEACKKILETQKGVIERISNIDTNSLSKELSKTVGETSENVKTDVQEAKDEILENLINIFAQISFVAESEDIKDFVSDKMDEIKEEIRRKVPRRSTSGNAESTSNMDLDEVLLNLDDLHNKTENVDNSCFDIKNELRVIKENLSRGFKGIQQLPQGENYETSDYDYSLQDLETDIAKVRMILKELLEQKSSQGVGSNFDIDVIREELTSLSSRTNKILLNSDDSYMSLKNNLNDLKNVVALFNQKMNDDNSKLQIDSMTRKIDEISKMVKTNVQSDKIFNQTFMYLAEWIDRADEKMLKLEQKIADATYVKQNMIKKSDLESMFDKFLKKMDKQQEKIKSLEDKIKELSKKESVVKPTATNIKTIVKEVLSKVDSSDMKADTKLAKKVDGIDKQLATIGKSIEKITSYVD